LSRGGAGTQTRIHVDIHSGTQGDFSKDFVFTPSNVRLIWEADTSVPPLFRGKALYSLGSRIKVVALPQVIANGAAIPPEVLSYQWSVDGEPVPNASGIGRSTLAYYGNQLKQGEQISLKVLYKGAAVGSASLVLQNTPPKILLYARDPLRGPLFDQALPASVSLLGKELTLQAQPYYFF
jgi:hypothetical protein